MPETVNGWTELVERWREDARPAPVASLRRRIATERRRMLWWVVADVVVSGAYVLLVVWALARYPGPWSRLLAADVGVMLAAAWVFAFWNRRGVWQPLGETTETYLALARLRCRRRLHAIRFGWIMLAAQVTLVVAWVIVRGPVSPLQWGRLSVLLPAGVVAGFAAALRFARRRVTRELDELQQFQEHP